MPSTSKQQFKFMKMIESGAIKKSGLSKEKAKEYTQGVDYKSLPKTNRHDKLKKHIKGSK